MIQTAKYHPYQIALDRAIAAFNCVVVQGIKQFWRNITLTRLAQ